MLATLRRAVWLCRDVTLPALREHCLRALLTLIGVVIGTQIVVAIGLVNRSVLESFTHTVETISGRADLQISNGSAGVPEELVDRLARSPIVKSASGVLQGTLRTEWGDLAVFGVDLFESQIIRETQFPRTHVHIKDALVFANSTDSIAVSTAFLERAGLAVGSELLAVGPTGKVTLEIRGSLDPVGPAGLFDGAVGLMDFPAAQPIFGRTGQFDQIDIMLAEHIGTARASTELAPLIDGVGVLEKPDQRGAALGSMLSAVQTGLAIVSFIAVIVGSFIIYHTMQTAIAMRQRELALVRALGYRRRVVSTAILLEVLAFGVFGSACGILLGVGAARLSLTIVTKGIAAIWTRVDDVGLALSPVDIVAAFMMGTTSALAAAILPLLGTGRMRILDHLHASEEDIGSPRWSMVREFIAALALCGSAYILSYSQLRPQGFVGQAALIMGSLVLATAGFTLFIPLVTALVGWPLAAVSERLPGAPAALATDNVVRDPRRTRGTIAALMVAFALVLEADAFIHSLRTSILTWFDETLTSDLLVAPMLQVDLPSGMTISGAFESRLRKIDGVAEISVSRQINVRTGDTVAVVRTESAAGFRRQHYQVMAGDPSTYQQAFVRGEAVLVSDNFAYRHRLTAGDMLALSTPTGSVNLPIAAVVLDYTLDIGTIVVEHELYRRLWNDDLANSFRIWLAPGAHLAAVRQAISSAANPDFRVVVLTAAEYKRTIARALDDALVLTYAIQLVAVAIAVIGVVNFFLAAVVDRRSTIRLLRSVALQRPQIIRLFALEAAIIGAIGGVMAAATAWPVGHAVVTRATRLVSGLGLQFSFRLHVAMLTIALTTAVSVVAALYPARRAARTSIHTLRAGE